MFKINGIEVDVEYTNSFQWVIKSNDIVYNSGFEMSFDEACKNFVSLVIENDEKKIKEKKIRNKTLEKFFSENCCMNCEYMYDGDKFKEDSYCTKLKIVISCTSLFFCHYHPRYKEIVDYEQID